MLYQITCLCYSFLPQAEFHLKVKEIHVKWVPLYVEHEVKLQKCVTGISLAHSQAYRDRAHWHKDRVSKQPAFLTHSVPHVPAHFLCSLKKQSPTVFIFKKMLMSRTKFSTQRRCILA